MNEQEKKTAIEELQNDDDLVSISGGAGAELTLAVNPKLLQSIETVAGVPGIIDPAGPVSDSVGVSVGCVSWSKDYKQLDLEKVVNTLPQGQIR